MRLDDVLARLTDTSGNPFTGPASIPPADQSMWDDEAAEPCPNDCPCLRGES